MLLDVKLKLKYVGFVGKVFFECTTGTYNSSFVLRGTVLQIERRGLKRVEEQGGWGTWITGWWGGGAQEQTKDIGSY